MGALASSRTATAALAVLSAPLALLAAAAFVPQAGELRHVLNVGVYDNVVLGAGAACALRARRVSRDRLAWLALGAALLAWGAGDTYWTFWVAGRPSAPSPSFADLGYLAVYPLAYVALVLLLRARVPRLLPSLWLDGVLGALAVAAAGAAIVFPVVQRTLGGPPAVVATNLAYPLADLTLVGLVVWSLCVLGWRIDREWALIAAGLVVFSLSDFLYLWQTAVGSYEDGSPTDLGWVAGALLLAWAAWQPRRRDERAAAPPTRALLAAPVLFGSLALGVLVGNDLRRVDTAAVVLAALAIGAVIARLALSFAENARMLAASRREARTDALTGLGNRRKLLDDLARADAPPRVLALFDLNGFKRYNDLFGHPAGDALLARLAGNLRRFVAGRGSAYRLGGDEFCVVVRRDDEGPPERVVEGACAALVEEGEGFAISAASGTVLLPEETGSPSEALRLADQRMYAQKQSLRGSAGEQSTGVLLKALAERDPKLGAHVDGVALMAAALAERLGLDPQEVERARLAAALHDLGKIAIPDEILRKPAALTEDEWEFVRRHPLVGERILLAAPSLAQVAPIVRSSHERYDGGGYPDGLAGTEIPLLARIVYVCDAFDAMTSTRPYAPALTVAEALEELRRGAGTQFDPVVAEAARALVASGVVAARAAGSAPARAAVA